MIRLYNQDCLEAMREMRDNEFDLAIVDPPYELPKRSGHGAGKLQNRKIQEMHQKGWDIAPKKEYFDQLFRVSKNQIIWGSNYFNDYLGRTRGIIAWDKQQPFENFSDFELAWTSFNCIARTFRYATTAVKGRIHPTQKPRELYSWLLQKYAQPGDKILDTHLGSGSSALAAHDLGFDFVGYELDTEYFDKAQERLRQHQRQLSLFGA